MTGPASIRNLFTASSPRRPLIAPSILSADFANMGEDCQHILQSADLLHLDVMDGHFVPNLTMGPDLCRALRRTLPNAFLDVHLMVTDPMMFVEPFAKAGANHFTFHVEAVPEDRIPACIDRVRAAGMTAGLAINPPTHVARILPLVAFADLLLVMSVNPGFSGQSFIPPVLEKTRAIAAQLRPDQRLQMDGGITAANAKSVRDAGCDVLVAASAIFGLPKAARPAAIAELRG